MKPFVAISCVSILLAIDSLASAAEPSAVPRAMLEIGDRAPAIDVSDWIHPGTHRPVKPFTVFEPGTIYVIEFWATWCEHSREVIPLLSSLHRKYDRDVVVVAVGVDPPEDLRGFLADPDPDVRELTAQAATYCIVADSDGSAHVDYMDAVMESELPTAFVVGRSGLVEWIGHPLELAEPLGRIVDGTWDRQAFAAEWTRRQAPRRLVDQTLRLIGDGKNDEAAAILDRFLNDDATTAAALNEFAWTLVLQSSYGRLPDAVMAAAERAATEGAARNPTDGNALDTLAHVLAVRGRLDEAIATQRKAVERGGANADMFRTYLRLLEARKH